MVEAAILSVQNCKFKTTCLPLFLLFKDHREIKVVCMSHSAELSLLKILFSPYAIKEWNKLDAEIRNAETCASFRKMLLKSIRPTGIKPLTILRLGFSYISDHKFRHNFADSLNPLCSCSLETESTLYLQFQNYTALLKAIVTELKNIDVFCFIVFE